MLLLPPQNVNITVIQNLFQDLSGLVLSKYFSREMPKQVRHDRSKLLLPSQNLYQKK